MRVRKTRMILDKIPGLRSFLVVIPPIILIAILLPILRISNSIAVYAYWIAPGIAGFFTILIANNGASSTTRRLVTAGILSAGFYCIAAPIVLSVCESMHLGSEIRLADFLVSYIYFFIWGGFVIAPAIVAGVAGGVALTASKRR